MKDTARPPPGLGSSAFKAGAPAREYVLILCTRGTVKRFRIPPGKPFSIGRSDTNDIVIPLDTVSRHHALIHDGVPPEIEDVGSLCGTVVAGRRLIPGERVRLQEGMAIQIGTITLVVHSSVTQEDAFDDDDAPDARTAGLVVRDSRMLALYRLLADVAPSDLSVLILGETGTGKELLAQWIHDRSTRGESPFVRLNCAALNESLAESELFGHERGAFTGADRPKIGLFLAAHEGTLFLDEVGELPLSIQAKLLRVLDKGEILPVGAVKPRRVAIRTVAATNRDLRAEVAAGRFRSDLYYRLTGVVAHVPPLRERIDDIAALVDFFAAPAAQRAGKDVPRFSDEAMVALAGYPWPGNVRELKHLVERVVLLARDGVVDAADIHLPGAIGPPPLSLFAAPRLPTAAGFPFADAPTRTDIRGVQAMAQGTVPPDERERILDALSRANGNQARAARLLGISRRTLINRLDEYLLPRPRKTYTR